jgi:hypothetical protein
MLLDREQMSSTSTPGSEVKVIDFAMQNEIGEKESWEGKVIEEENSNAGMEPESSTFEERVMKGWIREC